MLKKGFYFPGLALLTLAVVTQMTYFASAQEKAAANNVKKRTFENMPSVVAEVNGEKITKEQLAFEALKMHGREEVEQMIGLSLVLQECKRLNIAITNEDVQAEIGRFAAQFGLPVAQWLKVVEEREGLSYEQYVAKTKQWVGLKKIAGQSVQVSREEINRKLDAMYGPGVQVRQIVLFDKAKAEAVLQELQANPTKENFISVAKQKSDDPISASAGGLIPPIRRFSMPDNVQLENLLMGLKEGEMTGLVPMDQFFVIFRYEKAVPPMNVDREALAEKTYYMVEEEKIKKAATQILLRLVQASQIMNSFDSPQSQGATQFPNIIASINNEPIYSKTVAEICAMRHAGDILQGMIIQRIIDQKCKEANIAISQQEIEAELARIAAEILPLLPNGRPDTERLIAMQCREMKIDPVVYCSNVITPMLALKKMAASAVQITHEDMDKAYQATYGKKVEVLAIFLNEERKAHEVWSQARRAYDPNQKTHEQVARIADAFGKLANQYSVEQTSAANNGQIEPIARYCGMPHIEEVAFALQPGELSEIIPFDTVNGKQYLVLLCLGMTEPVVLSPNDPTVKDKLYAHVYDKKLEIEVSQTLNRLVSSATIENYLSGKVQSPALAGVPGSPVR